MRAIKYDQPKMIAQALGCLFLGLCGGVLAWAYDGWQPRLAGIFLAASLPVLAIAMVRRALGAGIAFGVGSNSLTVTTLFGHAVIPWSDVQSIHQSILQQSLLFGLIKQELGRYIVVVYQCEGKVQKISVVENLLETAKEDVPAMIDALVQYGSSPRQSRSTSGAPPFDPNNAPPRARSSTSGPVFGHK